MVATTVASDPTPGRRPLRAEPFLIDQFLPDYDLAVVHSRVLRAPPEQCFDTVVGFDLFQLRVFRVLFGARGLPQRLADALRHRADQTRAPTRPRFRLRDLPSMGWMLLGERPGVEFVFGQVGKSWKPRGGAPANPVTRAEFATFDRPGFAKLVESTPGRPPWRAGLDRDHRDPGQLHRPRQSTALPALLASRRAVQPAAAPNGAAGVGQDAGGIRVSALTARAHRPSPTAQEVAPGVWLVTLGRGAAASNVYLIGSDSAWTLVDAGWASSAEAIKTAAAAEFGPGAHPAAILLTHIHPDHSGAADLLARSWQVPVYVHPAELPMAAGRYLPQYAMPLDRWLVAPLLCLLPARTRQRIEAANSITDVVHPLPPTGGVPGLPDWQWVPTPGHTPGHVAYLRRHDVLLAGDAALTVDLNSLGGVLLGRQRAAGPPRYTTWDWPAATRSVAALADLEPRVLAPGHGRPLTVGTAAALAELAQGRPRPHRRRRRQDLVPRYSVGGRYRPPPRWYTRLQWASR
jgi:glyoxylase-like metal-dependent hydrolase (beta-lactamase superfamily II)